MVLLQTQDDSFRVQRKSVLQLAIQASCSYHVQAQKSFQLAPSHRPPPKLLTCRIDCSSVIWISLKNSLARRASYQQNALAQ